MLETIARYDNPVLIGKTGLRDYQDQKSAFCSKRTVAKVFEDLIINAKFKYIFLSYNNEGLMLSLIHISCVSTASLLSPAVAELSGLHLSFAAYANST